MFGITRELQARPRGARAPYSNRPDEYTAWYLRRLWEADRHSKERGGSGGEPGAGGEPRGEPRGEPWQADVAADAALDAATEAVARETVPGE